jgi:acyl-CoA synthetase (AMP-forming)/AMP-acid ligase II
MSAERAADSRPYVPFSCLPHLLEHQNKRVPQAPAILAPGRAPLTYGRLYHHIEEVGRTLRAMGIGRHDRVAVVLPNGPEMAVAILAVAASAACAPMNQAYGSEELSRYFADLRPRALITQAGIDAPARRAALAQGIRVIGLSTESAPEAGLFTLTGEHAGAASDAPVSASDVALLLLTSGTTSRPKIVPLTHASICASAYSTVSALALCETDCGINMLPLFHGHGLNNNLLASLAAGASIVCTPGCDVNSFFAWLKAFQPTWYSAVPTMHQAILAQARHKRERAAPGRLRFIRSASAALPPAVFAELEQAFETPVIESYGMTETASSFIACNPLPPRLRKAGSVGLPVGLDVAIMNQDGALLPGGETGQVMVRGASVMAGYDRDQSATAAAFAGDWFKTGDLGFFDDDGYLFLAGRIREIINRGGEKIAPQEVDDVLLQHPAVAEVVTFAVPHATLGEDVASVVVLRSQGVGATPKDIRQFAIGRIADFKVPRQVLIVSAIPKGPTGKTQRIGLAARLGLGTGAAPPHTFVPPRTPLETLLAAHWAEILQVAQIGIHDDFFAAGGDSLLATSVLCHIYEVTQVELEVSRFFDAPTVAEVVQHLERLIYTGQAPRPSSPIARVPRKNGVMPASSAQERLWRLQHALADIPFFNVLYALRLTSPCNAAVLERSINEIVRRHEILRTTLAVIGGRYMQVIAPQLIVPLEFDDLRVPPHSNDENIGHQIIQEEALHSFDLAKGPLIRTRLLRLAEAEYLLLISMHQVICDGWSLGVLVQELITLYDTFSAQGESPLAPLSYQYADFAHWQRDWRSRSEIVAQLAYWREQLRAPLPVIRLAKPGRRPTSDDLQDDLQTARRRWTLPASLADAAKRFSQRERGTLFMALVAALKTLLHRQLGEDDLCVATNVANRNRPGTEALIGPLTNTVVLRTNLSGDPSSREVLRRVRATTLAAFDHQDLPFEEVAETLERERATRPASLAQIMILLQNATLRPPARFEGTLACEEAIPSIVLPLVTTTTFDVIFALIESGLGLVGTCIYKPHLFSAEEIDRLLQGFETVIEQMVAQPEQPISEIRVLEWNDRAGK